MTQLVTAEQLIEKEIERTESKGDYNSLHEAYAVLLEEVDEFWDEVKKKPRKRCPINTLKN
jgi:glycyl-tRNA synthetase beta subunit